MKTPTMSRLEPPNGYREEAPLEEKVPASEWHRVMLGLLLQALQWHFRAAERIVATGDKLRLWNPAERRWVPAYPEREAAALARIRELEAELARRGRGA